MIAAYGVGYLPLYSNSPYNQLREIKMDILKNHAAFKKFSVQTKKTFDRRLLNLNKDVVLNYNDILNGISNVFAQNQNLSAGITIGGQHQIGIMGGSYSLTSKGAAKQIASHIEVLKKALIIIGNAITQIDTALSQGAGFDAAVVNLILSGDPEALNKIPNGIYNLPMSDIKTISSSYTTLKSLTQQLTDLGPGVAAGQVKSEEVYKLMQGISGALNNIKGIVFEAESLAAFANAEIQGLEKLHVLNTGATSNSDITRILEDPNIKTAISENKQLLADILNLPSKAGGHPKADLTLTFGTAGGTGTVGISIKNSSGDFSAAANRWRNTVSIGSQANLYSQIFKAEPYLSQLTGINGLYYGKMAYSILASKNDGTDYAGYWRSYVDTVAILNILDNLTGTGGFGNTAAYFVVNTKVFPMKNVLLKILENPQLVYGSTTTRAQGTALNQKAYVELKDGITKQEAAMQRSDILNTEITTAFNKASLNTKIDMSLLGMLL